MQTFKTHAVNAAQMRPPSRTPEEPRKRAGNGPAQREQEFEWARVKGKEKRDTQAWHARNGPLSSSENRKSRGNRQDHRFFRRKEPEAKALRYACLVRHQGTPRSHDEMSDMREAANSGDLPKPGRKSGHRSFWRREKCARVCLRGRTLISQAHEPRRAGSTTSSATRWRARERPSTAKVAAAALSGPLALARPGRAKQRHFAPRPASPPGPTARRREKRGVARATFIFEAV